MEQNNTQNLPATYTEPAAYAVPQPAPAVSAPTSYFTDMTQFENGQRMAKLLCSSGLVPQQFRNNIPDTLIALEMAARTGSSPLAVMQSMYVVHGRPSWSATFIIAAITSCGRFSPLRFEMTGEGDDLTCRAWAVERASGEALYGPPVSVATAKREGWFGKQGSKWQTMPELMLHYRAATLFGRIYAADVLMGMKADDELDDIGDATPAPKRRNGEATGEVTGEAGTSTLPQSGAAAINALLEADQPAARPSGRSEESPADGESARPDAGDSSASPRNDGREGDAAPPEYRAMMAYIAEIEAIDDPEALRRWWQERDYKQILDELGGMNSEWHQAVAERVRDRIADLEAGPDEETGKKTAKAKGKTELPPALTKYLESKQ